MAIGTSSGGSRIGSGQLSQPKAGGIGTPRLAIRSW
jgi:hypothetical protein